MVYISRKTHERNVIGAIVDNDGILWLNEKHMEEGLDHKTLREITIKHHSDHRKRKYELVEEPKREVNRILIDEKLAVKLIMDCKTTTAHTFRTRLGFKQYDVILTKELLVLTKIMSSFEGGNIQTQYNVLNYRIDLYFHDYKLAIKTDENGHSNKNIDYKIKRQKAIEQVLSCKFIRIDPDKEDYDIFRAINEIFRHNKQSTKKTLIYKISTRLLLLEFKSDNIAKSKAIKFIVNNGKLLHQL